MAKLKIKTILRKIKITLHFEGIGAVFHFSYCSKRSIITVILEDRLHSV